MGEIIFFVSVGFSMFAIAIVSTLLLLFANRLTSGFISESEFGNGMAQAIFLFLVSFAVLYGVQYYALDEASDNWFGKNGVIVYATSIAILLSILGFFVEIARYFHKTHKQRQEHERNMLDVVKTKAEEDEKRKIEIERQREQEEWQKQLDREIERERRLAEVRNESTLQAMQMQIKLYGEYKEKGLDIEKKIFELRKNLIELEGQENKAMLDEVRQALDELEN